MNNSYGLNNPFAYQQPNMNGYFGNPAPMGQPMVNSVQRQMGLYGRMINAVEEVKPQEVPMDGSIGIFPTYDYSKIYTKYWDANGRIQTEVYEKQSGPTETDLSASDPFAAVMERLDKIEQMLSTRPEVTEDVQRATARNGSAAKKSGGSE